MNSTPSFCRCLFSECRKPSRKRTLPHLGFEKEKGVYPGENGGVREICPHPLAYLPIGGKITTHKETSLRTK